MAIENGVLKLDGTIQLRGGTYAALSSQNPFLAVREIMIEIDTGKIKVGDGLTYWNSLPYVAPAMPGNDNKVYVLKNGAYVEARLVEQPSEWSPEIDDTEEIVLTIDEDMTPYQLTGTNAEVNILE